MNEPKMTYTQAWDKMSSAWQRWQDLVKLATSASKEEYDAVMIKVQEAEKDYNEAQTNLDKQLPEHTDN